MARVLCVFAHVPVFVTGFSTRDCWFWDLLGLAVRKHPVQSAHLTGFIARYPLLPDGDATQGGVHRVQHYDLIFH